METATEPQVRFLKSLLDTRMVPESTAATIHASLAAGMPKRKASEWIDALKILAWKPKAPAPSTAGVQSAFAEADAALAAVDTSFFAIPAGYVSAQSSLIDLNGNDHLFVRVRNWNGKRTISRVQGSVGGFTYWRIRNPKLQLMLAKLIAERGQEFQQEFHRLTGKCGRCAADLTDLKSRTAGFGPDCRKAIGMR